MKDCWINMLELYQILDTLSEQGIITEGQKSIIEAYVDGMEFICVPKECEQDDNT